MKLCLTERVVAAEDMDSPSLPREELIPALRDLWLFQRLSFTAWSLSKEIETFCKTRGLSRIKLLDLGCGDGALLSAVHTSLVSKGLRVESLGVDMNPTSTNIGNLRNIERLRFNTLDITYTFPEGEFDIILSSLFLHHLQTDQVFTIFKKLKKSSAQLIVVNDLKRSVLGFTIAFLASRLLSSSKVVQKDALLSVRAAFTVSELSDIAKNAGFESAYAKTCFPGRFNLVVYGR